MRPYLNQRDYENIQHGRFPSCGENNIPIINPVKQFDGIESLEWMGWNVARGIKDKKKRNGKAVHFFIDDYHFLCLWKTPYKYLDFLKCFNLVLSPDFSVYADFPKAIQVYNHYRKHWLAALWQSYGINVIPTVTWSDPSTLDWAFDGEPRGGCVAISSYGMVKDPMYRSWLIDGYKEMSDRLSPSKILWIGEFVKELEPDIDKMIFIPSHVRKWREDSD